MHYFVNFGTCLHYIRHIRVLHSSEVNFFFVTKFVIFYIKVYLQNLNFEFGQKFSTKPVDTKVATLRF